MNSFSHRSISKYIFAFVLTFGVYGGVNAQTLKLEADLDRSEVDFSELVTLTYRLTFDSKLIALASHAAPRPELKRLEFYSMSSSSNAVTEAGIQLTEQVYEYRLKPIASGAGRIEPVTIEYLLLSDSTTANVTSVALKTQIALPVPVDDSETSGFWLWLALAALAVGGGIAFWMVRSGSADSEDPHTIAVHTRLVLLKSLTAKPRSQFYQTLYDALYDLAKEADLTEARRGDSDQLIADIQSATLPGEIRDALTRWLSRSAKEKFAPGAGQPGETLREYHEIEDFLRDIWLPFRRTLDATRARATQLKK